MLPACLVRAGRHRRLGAREESRRLEALAVGQHHDRLGPHGLPRAAAVAATGAAATASCSGAGAACRDRAAYAASESVAHNIAVPPEPLITASIETAPADKAPSVAPLAPPKADLSDPYQRRASAVGLHPDLSRALLARLSPADFRNAGVAIDTAVAKTPETDTFVWPRQRRPELALFQVRFVPGAAPDCRRYVVTITKDRWSTTALPMERCGAKLAARKSAP